jgi:hypothetical protein
MGKSTSSRTSRKALAPPKKPYTAFPLTPHPRGQWVKKIRGKVHCFGRWARLVDGRTPRETSDGLLVKDLCNRFLTTNHRKAEAGELSTAMFTDYKIVAELLVSQFGANRFVDDLIADDFTTL